MMMQLSKDLDIKGNVVKNHTIEGKNRESTILFGHLYHLGLLYIAIKCNELETTTKPSYVDMIRL